MAQLAAAQSNEQLLPAGPEKEKMVKLCVGCHEIDLVVARRHTREEWDGVVEDMIARGSKGTEEELSLVAEYLSKYLGKVSVNTATAKEVQDGLKISDKDAQADRFLARAARKVQEFRGSAQGSGIGCREDRR